MASNSSGRRHRRANARSTSNIRRSRHRSPQQSRSPRPTYVCKTIKQAETLANRLRQNGDKIIHHFYHYFHHTPRSQGDDMDEYDSGYDSEVDPGPLRRQNPLADDADHDGGEVMNTRDEDEFEEEEESEGAANEAGGYVANALVQQRSPQTTIPRQIAPSPHTPAARHTQALRTEFIDLTADNESEEPAKNGARPEGAQTALGEAQHEEEEEDGSTSGDLANHVYRAATPTHSFYPNPPHPTDLGNPFQQQRFLPPRPATSSALAQAIHDSRHMSPTLINSDRYRILGLPQLSLNFPDVFFNDRAQNQTQNEEQIVEQEGESEEDADDEEEEEEAEEAEEAEEGESDEEDEEEDEEEVMTLSHMY